MQLHYGFNYSIIAEVRMNIFSVIGLIMALGVLMGGLRLASANLQIFWDIPSVFIVVGGTIAATAIAYQLDKILLLFKTFFKIVVLKNVPKNSDIIVEMIKIGDSYRKGSPLDGLAAKVKDAFLKESLVMVSDGILTPEHILKILDDRANNMDVARKEEAGQLKVVAKFAPAFGMMGTTIGMIVLLANLGGEDALKMIGPAMGVCLITTLYGVVIANLALLPVAENLITHSKNLYLKDLIVIEGVKLIMSKQNPVILAEELNSFLTPEKRINWKDIIGKG
jgi:chemotaxis protein MotA